MKTVLITGASRGLGQALAHVFAEAEYRLILHSHNRDLPDLAGEEHVMIKGNIWLRNTINALEKRAQEFDLDILINNAGIRIAGPIMELAPGDLRGVIETNLIAPMILTKALWPIFAKKRSGMVINIGSLAGKGGSDGETAYCASKFGLRGFSAALQFDASRDGVRVINVNLGAMKTDMTMGRKDFDDLMEPWDVARQILSLTEINRTAALVDIDIVRRREPK